MKLENAKISILINREYTEIELYDSNSSSVIALVKLTPEQLSNALSRLKYADCECKIGDVSKFGKKMEWKQIEFPIAYSKSIPDLSLNCSEYLFNNDMHEWVSDNYYGSQNSFFTKDGINYARVIVRRWI